jgi:hypothetical protein
MISLDRPPWASGSQCISEIAERAELGRITRLYPYSIPPRMGTTVCGLNGKTYPDTPSALKETTVLHGGSCGRCSEPSNIEVYRKTSQTLFGLTRNCAVVNMLMGREAAAACFEKSGLTESCSQCWFLNMDCSLIHCFGPCLAAKLRGTPNLVDGQLNECLRCDETHCGAPFIRCAGVNRRRAGIRSDIDRADDEIWQRK